MLCAYCRERPVDERWRPFCSERCKLLDLANWIDGAYRVPAEEADALEPEQPAAEEPGSDTQD